jgi:outer membrane immunogenic protein
MPRDTQSGTLASTLNNAGLTMRLMAVVAAAGLTAAIGAAHGEDIAAPTADWSGFYAGIYAGYGVDRQPESSSSSSISQVDDDDSYSGSFESWSSPAATLLGDVRAGYNFQHGALVLGLEGSVGAAALDRSVGMDYELSFIDLEDPEDSFDVNLGMQNSFSAGAIGTFTGQIGFAVADWLIYGKGGLAVTQATTRLSFDGNYSIDGGEPIEIDASSQTSGLLLGTTFAVGAQTKLNEQMSVGAELGMVSFREQDVPVPGGIIGLPIDIPAIGIGSVPELGATSIYTAKVGLNYHF